MFSYQLLVSFEGSLRSYDGLLELRNPVSIGEHVMLYHGHAKGHSIEGNVFNVVHVIYKGATSYILFKEDGGDVSTDENSSLEQCLAAHFGDFSEFSWEDGVWTR